MEAVVTSVKHSTSNTYTVAKASEKGVEMLELKSDFMLNPGEMIDLKDFDSLPSSGDPKSYFDRVSSMIDSVVEKTIVKKPYSVGFDEIDAATTKMWTQMGSAAGLVLRKLIIGSPIIIRFHNDADGSSGAVGLYRAIMKLSESVGMKPNIVWLMHRGVAYEERDAESDILIANGYSSVEKPLLLIVDFGTSTGSNKGISLVEGRFDVVWLDHHPIEEGFAGVALKNYISPWNFGSDSAYTAGLLACVFSHALADSDTKELESGSLVGDYSRFVPTGDVGTEVATILDLITSDPKIISKIYSNITPAEIDNALKNPEKRKELYNYAKMRLDETLDAAFNSIKTVKAGKSQIFVLDYGEMRSTDSKYPLPGRFSSRLLAKIEETGKGPCVVVVHFNSYISMRVSMELGDVVDIPSIITEMKELHGESIESGGGHKNAASIKVGLSGDKKEILKSVTDVIKEKLEKYSSNKAADA